MVVAVIGAAGLTLGGVALTQQIASWQKELLALADLVFIGLSLVIGVDLPEDPALPRSAAARDGTMAVVGMGGAGKTVLAAEVAYAPEIHERFPDGVTWIEADQRPDVLELQAIVARRQAGGSRQAIGGCRQEAGEALSARPDAVDRVFAPHSPAIAYRHRVGHHAALYCIIEHHE